VGEAFSDGGKALIGGVGSIGCNVGEAIADVGLLDWDVGEAIGGVGSPL
jgi:hypothetical protein